MVTDRWFVKVGQRFRIFSQPDWAKDGLAWVSAQLVGDPAPAKNPGNLKSSEEQK
jgi:hypothetical protein